MLSYRWWRRDWRAGGYGRGEIFGDEPAGPFARHLQRAVAPAATAATAESLANLLPIAAAPEAASPTPVLATRVSAAELPAELAYLRDLDTAGLWAMLDEEQAKVMRWLLWGEGPTRAAEKTGVARSQIYRWKGQPLFRAIYELLKRDRLAENKDGVQMLSSRAVRVLAARLDSGDRQSGQLAMQLLKELGMFGKRE